MPLLGILFALLLPRITVLVLYFFTAWFNGVFATVLWPVLGFIFLPTTLLWYSAVQKWFSGEWGIIPVIGMIVAVVVDLAPARKRRAIEQAA